MAKAVIGTSEKDGKERIGFRPEAEANNLKRKITGVTKWVTVEMSRKKLKELLDMKRDNPEEYNTQLLALLNGGH